MNESSKCRHENLTHDTDFNSSITLPHNLESEGTRFFGSSVSHKMRAKCMPMAVLGPNVRRMTMNNPNVLLLDASLQGLMVFPTI